MCLTRWTRPLHRVSDHRAQGTDCRGTDAGESAGRVFGCDICQDVCPWNRKAPIAVDPELEPRRELINPALEWLAAMDEAEFERDSSMARRCAEPGFSAFAECWRSRWQQWAASNLPHGLRLARPRRTRDCAQRHDGRSKSWDAFRRVVHYRFRSCRRPFVRAVACRARDCTEQISFKQ